MIYTGTDIIHIPFFNPRLKNLLHKNNSNLRIQILYDSLLNKSNKVNPIHKSHIFNYKSCSLLKHLGRNNNLCKDTLYLSNLCYYYKINKSNYLSRLDTYKNNFYKSENHLHFIQKIAIYTHTYSNSAPYFKINHTQYSQTNWYNLNKETYTRYRLDLSPINQNCKHINHSKENDF